MLNVIANFGLALVATLVVAGLAKWIAGRLMAEGSSIASFGVACGYVVGRYSSVDPGGADISNNVAELAGAVLAVVLLWFLLFRREQQAGNR